MPQIGWIEIFLIVILTIIIVGPKDFPIVLRKISSWIRTIKNYIHKIQKEVNIFDNENVISNEQENSNDDSKNKKSEADINVENKK